jgi:hypothetical protein
MVTVKFLLKNVEFEEMSVTLVGALAFAGFPLLSCSWMKISGLGLVTEVGEVSGSAYIPSCEGAGVTVLTSVNPPTNPSGLIFTVALTLDAPAAKLVVAGTITADSPAGI